MSTLSTLTTSTAGVVGLEVVQNLPFQAPDPANNTVSLVLQVIIAIITLLKLFKKPSLTATKTTENEN